MPVQNNVLDTIADRITVVMPPLSGVTELLYFEDLTIGETANRFLKREYRYAKNEGLFYTSWQAFTSLGGLAVVFDNPTIVWVEVRYTRAGTDTTGIIEFTSCNLFCDYGVMPTPEQPVTDQSVIANYGGYQREFLELRKNLLAKFYRRGVIPQYITRGDIKNPEETDRDYVDFWKAIIGVMASLMLKNDNLQKFDLDVAQLSDYLYQFNHLFNKGKLDLLQIRYLMKNAYDEFRKRGTYAIFEPATENNTPVNGEFLRLINWDDDDEIIHCLYYNERIGWNVGNSSPLYRGSSRNPQNNKVKDFSLSSFIPEVVAPFDAVYADTVAYSKKSIEIDISLSDRGALNYYEDGVSPRRANTDSMYLIDEAMDYEVSFWVGSSTTDQMFTFIANIFDKDLNWGGAYPVNVGGDGVGDSRFTVRIPQPNRFYFVRIHFYNIFRTNYNPIEINTGKGSNFAMYRGSKWLLPTFLFDKMGTGGMIWIGDLQIHPTVKGVRQQYADGLGSFSTGFLNTNNLMSIVCNNRGTHTKQQVDNLTRRFLLPYNTVLVLDVLNKVVLETNFGYQPDPNIDENIGIFDSTFDGSFD